MLWRMIRISISKDLKERLRRRKRPGETYNDVVLRLIEEYKALQDTDEEESNGRDPS
jgi:predicted CopG family antitoxin